MKTLIILGALMLISVFAQAQGKVRIDSDNNKVIAQSSSRSSETTVIPWTYVDKEGNEFPIYMTENGSCFVFKTSKKTGKEYKYYLGKETSKEICRKLGVTYKGKK